METQKNKDSIGKTYKEVGPYLGLGVQLAATILIMLYIGSWLDKKYDAGSTYTLIFAIVGIAIGLYQLIKTVLFLEKKSKTK